MCSHHLRDPGWTRAPASPRQRPPATPLLRFPDQSPRPVRGPHQRPWLGSLAAISTGPQVCMQSHAPEQHSRSILNLWPPTQHSLARVAAQAVCMPSTRCHTARWSSQAWPASCSPSALVPPPCCHTAPQSHEPLHRAPPDTQQGPTPAHLRQLAGGTAPGLVHAAGTSASGALPSHADAVLAVSRPAPLRHDGPFLALQKLHTAQPASTTWLSPALPAPSQLQQQWKPWPHHLA